MASPFRVASFLDLTEHESFHNCLHLIKDNSRRCGNVINRFDRPQAVEIFRQILSALGQSSLLQLLIALAKTTMCNHVHRPRLDSASFDGIARQWMTECQGGRIRPEPALRRPALSMRDLVAVETSHLRQAIRRSNGHHDLSPRRRSNETSATIQYPVAVDFDAVSHDTFEVFDSSLTTDRTRYINEKVLALLNRPLTQKNNGPGYIYIYTRSCNPGLIKIGYSKDDPERRVRKWGSVCCHDTQVRYSTSLVPSKLRIEQLIHAELHAFRLREKKCKWSDKCSTKHTEWFNVDLATGIEVVNRWAEWAIAHKPWTTDLALKPRWANLLDQYRIALQGPIRDPHMWKHWAESGEPRRPATRRAAPVDDDDDDDGWDSPAPISRRSTNKSLQNQIAQQSSPLPRSSPPAMISDTEDSSDEDDEPPRTPEPVLRVSRPNRVSQRGDRSASPIPSSSLEVPPLRPKANAGSSRVRIRASSPCLSERELYK